MKTLVVYYTRTGNSKRVAENIARTLKADKEEIIDLKDRKRVIIGWLIAGKDATQKKLTEIKYKKDPSKYDLVVIGGPVWAWTVCPAVRTYLTQNKSKIKKVAFFCTNEGQAGKTFEEMKGLCKKPLDILNIKNSDKNSESIIKKFCKKLK